MLLDDDNIRRPPPAGKQVFFRFIHYLSELDHVSQPPFQNYTAYHERYLKWDCENKHNTTFFDKCCHPLLVGSRVAILSLYSHTTQKNESISVLEKLGCKAPNDECDDGDYSVPPSSTSSTPAQPAYANASPPASSSAPSKPAIGGIAKADDTSSPWPTPTPSPTTPTYTPPKSSSSPPPAQTSGSGSGGDVHTGGQYVPWSLFFFIYSPCLPRATYFYQNGVAGACGQTHQDTDMICAIGECSLRPTH